MGMYTEQMVTVSEEVRTEEVEEDKDTEEGKTTNQRNDQAEERIFPNQQRIAFAGPKLDNGPTLPDHSFQKESWLHLMLRLCSGMTIVKTRTGKTIPQGVSFNDIIKENESEHQRLRAIPS